MKLSTFLMIKAVICFIFGLPALLVPEIMGTIFGMPLTQGAELMTRYFGVGFIGIGLILWYARGAPRDNLVNGILFSLSSIDFLGFIVALMAMLQGVMNVYGWVTVVVWLLMALGCSYYRFIATESV